MGKCTALESAPTRFYAPSGLFTDEDLRQLSAEYLGEVIVSPGGSFRYQVTSGPLCRLYWERGKPQPNVNESAYCRNSSGKGWKRSHPNFLSYQIADGSFITVRWQLPIPQTVGITEPSSAHSQYLSVKLLSSKIKLKKVAESIEIS